MPKPPILNFFRRPILIGFVVILIAIVLTRFVLDYTLPQSAFLSTVISLLAWSLARHPFSKQDLATTVAGPTTSITQTEVSERYFRALIENCADAIVLLDITGKVLYQSPSTESISGYSLSEIQALDGFDLIHPDDREKDGIMFAELVQSPGKVLYRTHRLRSKSGGYLWLEGTYVNLLGDPYVKAIVYNYHDTTQRVLAEEAIIHEKIVSDNIINSLPGIFYLYDRDGKFIRWNRNFEVTSGYSHDDVSRMHPLDFFPQDEKELVKAKITSVFVNGRDDIEAHLRTRDGRRIPYYFNGSLANFDGTDHLIGMGIDITERKRVEEEVLVVYREKETTLNRINDAVVSLDLEWRYTFLNDAALATHPGGREGTLGKTILEIHPELENTVFWQMYQESMRTMKVMQAESHYAPMDIWFSAKAYPSSDGITIFYQDVTDRKKTEQQKLDLIAKLMTKNRDLRQFSYIVSHNLRAPIAKIAGLADLMGDDQNENKQIIPLIAEATRHLDEIVMDMNNIISARRSDQERAEQVSFGKLLDQIKITFAETIAETKATISSDFSQVAEITSIKSFVHSILSNLISNAIKYRQPTVPLVIHVSTTFDEGYICLSVKDNGRGIDLKANKGKVFGLYRRFHGDEVPGRGIGLNLVKTHAETLGGQVELQSEVNIGSTFKIFIPLLYTSTDEQ